MKKKKRKSLLTKIKESFSNTYNQYNSLTKTAKTIIWLWIIILLIIIIVIILCGNNKKVSSSHEEIEKAMNKAAEKYAEDKGLLGSKDQKVRIDMNELLDSNNLSESDITDDTCIGYSLYYIVYNEKGEEKAKTKSYINCKKYTTEEYKKIQ